MRAGLRILGLARSAERLPTRLGENTSEGARVSPTQSGLYFWHIPKTAGMSVWAWLEPHFPRETVYPGHLLPDLLRDAADPDLRSKRLFRGHFADAPLQLVSRRLTTMTVLREPVSRTLSHLAHVERAPEHPMHERVVSYAGHLDGLLQDPVVRRMLTDFQCRYLGLPFAPDPEPEDEVAWVVPPGSPLRAMMAFEMAPLPPRRVLLLSALARLARVDHVGTSDALEVLFRSVAASRGWPPVTQTPRENMRSDAQQHLLPERLTPDQRHVVQELTRGDRVLYRAAHARVRTALLSGR
jgi:hypothetical protein